MGHINNHHYSLVEGTAAYVVLFASSCGCFYLDKTIEH